MCADAITAFRKTIEIYEQRGRFRQAADRESAFCCSCPSSCAQVMLEDIGQIYQQDGSDLRLAMEAFERAGDLYSGEDATAFVRDLVSTRSEPMRVLNLTGQRMRVTKTSLILPRCWKTLTKR